MAQTDVKQQVVSPAVAKWAHLKPNQHCHLVVDENGTHRWRNPLGQYHRVGENGIQDGPAVIYPKGFQIWYFNGMRHRVDGPAWDWGVWEWYLEGVWLTQEQWARDL